MNEVKKNLEQCQESGWIPEHKCKYNLIILEETHSVNSLHNIVIARKSKCKICSNIFEAYDPRGLK
jgi:predicted transcriptional regulator